MIGNIHSVGQLGPNDKYIWTCVSTINGDQEFKILFDIAVSHLRRLRPGFKRGPLAFCQTPIWVSVTAIDTEE